MSLGRMLTLKNAVKAANVPFPQIGFGTWQSKPGEVEKAVAEALKAGYRHIDAALIYGNQAEVGSGIANSGVPRENITLVSKLWNTGHRPENVEAELDLTLKQLGTSYLDLYLIHWPVPFPPGQGLAPRTADKKETIIDKEAPSVAETWREMLRILKETDKVKAVGVSNFTVDQLELITKATGVAPAVNQIEAHPQLIQPELYKYCADKGIVITAYSPLGNNITGKARVIDSPEVQAIAQRLGVEPAQVLIAWGAKNGFAVIPKSVTPSRIKSNFQTFDLADSDFEELNRWGTANRVRSNIPNEYKPRWPINVFNEPSEQKEPNHVW